MNENPTSTVRAKAVCTEVKQELRDDNSVWAETVTLSGVYSDDPNSENKWFAQATPLFSVVQRIENVPAFDTFKEGKQYYVDFTEAPDQSSAVIQDQVTQDEAATTADPADPQTTLDTAPAQDVAAQPADQTPAADPVPAQDPVPPPTGETDQPASDQ